MAPSVSSRDARSVRRARQLTVAMTSMIIARSGWCLAAGALLVGIDSVRPLSLVPCRSTATTTTHFSAA
jgi:hypothetical protein